MNNVTTIRITKQTSERLTSLGTKSDTYESIIQRDLRVDQNNE